MEPKGKIVKNVYVKYSLLYAVVALIVFCQLLIFDKTLIWNIDGYLQRYSVYAKFYDSFRDLFSGQGFPLWDWSIGLGSDRLSNFAFIIFDPFSYVSLFFSKAHLDLAYSFIIVLKLYTAGIVMLYYLQYHKKSSNLCLMGAIGYAFCVWGLTCARHDFFVTELIIFPLLVLGVDKIEDQKSPLTLIITVWWTVLHSVYFSYMSALFILIYVMVRFFTSEGKKTVGTFVVKIGWYILYAVTGGILLAAPVLVPAVYSLLRAGKGSGADILLLPSLKQLLRFVPAFAGNQDIHDNYSVIGMNCLFVSMMPAIFFQLKRKKASAWMFWISALFLLIPALQSVTNGFSYASGRWSYVMNFFFVYAAIECLEWEKVLKKTYVKWILLTVAIIFGWGFVAFLIFGALNSNTMIVILMNLMFVAVFYFVLYEQDALPVKKQWICTVLVSANCALMGFCFYNPQLGISINTLMTRGQCHKIYSSSSMRAVEKIQEDDFYRIDTVDYPSNTGENVPYSHTPANMALYWNAPAISEYLSTVDSGWLEFNHLLGNNSGYFRRMCTYSNDNRARMNFLLGVKYFLGSDSKKEYASAYSKYAGYGFSKNSKSKGVTILKSAYDAGLGYVYDSAIADTDLLEYSPLEREQILMQCAEVEGQDLDTLSQTPKKSLSEISLENTKQIPYQLSTGNGMKLSGNGFSLEKPSTLTIQLNQTVTNSEIYVVFKNLKKQNFNKEKLWKMSLQEQAGDKLQRNQFNLSRMSHVDYGNFSITITRGKIEKRVINAEGEPQGIRDVGDYITNTGYVDQYTGKIECYFETIGNYSYDDIQIVAVPMENFAEQASVLQQHRFQVTKYGNDRIEGNIDTEQGGLLYLSVFYDSGWDIYIDGKKADKTYRVNTAFMGVEVSEGYHDIVMKFRPLGAPYTYLLFGIGVISAGLLYAVYLRRRKRTHQKEKTKA